MTSDSDDPGGLALIAAGFPAYRFWREATCDGTGYVAQGTSLATRRAPETDHHHEGPGF